MDYKRKQIIEYQSEQIDTLQKKINLLLITCQFNKNVGYDISELFKFTYNIVKHQIPEGDLLLIHQKWAETVQKFEEKQEIFETLKQVISPQTVYVSQNNNDDSTQ